MAQAVPLPIEEEGELELFERWSVERNNAFEE
jgi:hypothetical protein